MPVLEVSDRGVGIDVAEIWELTSEIADDVFCFSKVDLLCSH